MGRKFHDVSGQGKAAENNLGFNCVASKDADCRGVQSQPRPGHVTSTTRSPLRKIILLVVTGLVPACAHVPGGMPVQDMFVEADRTVNYVIGGDRSETITTRIANKREHSTLAVLACGVLDVVMLPFDLFATAPVLDHCDYWSRYDAETRARREAIAQAEQEDTPASASETPSQDDAIGRTLALTDPAADDAATGTPVSTE